MKREGGLECTAVGAKVGVGGKGGGSQPSLAALAVLRGAAYGLLASLFCYPEEVALARILNTACLLKRRSHSMAGLAFYPAWQDFLRCLHRLLPSRLLEVQRTYREVLGNGSSLPSVPLCESAYLDSSALNAGWVLADVEREYASAGLRVSGPRGETADHLRVELEYLSFLCGQEGGAWAARDPPGTLTIVRREARFLRKHPCRWLCALAVPVSQRDRLGLYAAAIRAARALTTHDADFLDLMESRIRSSLQGGLP